MPRDLHEPGTIVAEPPVAASSDATAALDALGVPLAVANALGVAWATYQLHPDPRGRLGFDRAIDELAAAPGIEYLEIEAKAFTWDRAELESTHPGTSRIVDRLYVHGVGIIQFFEAPTADDVVALFEVIGRTPEQLDAAGGPAEALKEAGVHSLRLLERTALTDADDDDDEPDATEFGGSTDPTEYSGHPEALAAALLKAAGDDPAALASLVVDTYSRAQELIDTEDVWQVEEIVHTFVDMFFFLPEKHQTPLMSEVLARHADPVFRTVLDQFSSHELQAMAPLLDSDTHPLLVEYARIAGETAGRSEEMADLIYSGTAEPVDEVVTRRIEEVLSPRRDVVAGDGVGELPLAGLGFDPTQRFATGAGVLTRLLAVVPEEVDRRRLLRIWAGKVTGAVRRGDLDAAVLWLDTLPATERDKEGEPFQAMERAMGIEVVAELVDLLHQDPDLITGSGLLNRLAPHLRRHLVDLLGVEPDQGKRRTLIEIIVEVAGENPEWIVGHFDDPRWYLLRNLILIVGRTHRPDLVDHVRRFTAHPDERVRRETLRAIHALTRHEDPQPFVQALGDSHETVRKAAATILRNFPNPMVVAQLTDMLAGSASPDAKLEAVILLGALQDEAAKAVLDRVARGRGSSRRLRAAAREALGSSS